MMSQQSEVAEMLGKAASEGAAEPSSGSKLHSLLIDSSRNASQQRRTEYFGDEALKHYVLETDGQMSGNETLKKILDEHDSGLGSPPIIFNITGAVTGSSIRFFLLCSCFFCLHVFI
jgi:aromatic ring-opening dioxygenase catalytic subunit (LigB family)